MKNNWNKILNELSYRVSSGIPDLTNEQHLIKLWDILKEHKWNIDARVELLKNLSLNEDWWSDMTPPQQQQYIKDHPNSQKALNAKEREKTDKKVSKSDNGDEVETDTLSKEKREELTKKDTELVETQLFLFEGDPQDAGGLGTPQSRTGECVTTYALCDK